MNCNVPSRTIFCHDNLDVLRNINSDCIDIIYLDPPFNKKKPFTAPVGSSAEGASFSDIFRQEDVKEEWVQSIREDNTPLYNLLQFALEVEGRTSYNFCYLSYMAIRLLEIYRVLSGSGSIYLHCDPTMSHYLKLVMDCIFGEKNFRNEIVWGYRTGGVSKNHFPRKHDTIFLYSKSNKYKHNPLQEIILYDTPFFTDAIPNENGKYEVKVYVRDVWEDGVKPVINMSKEHIGYPTQKPLALLERIIQASSNEGDIVLDPFCGCATTCVAAEKLNRKWIGIDISIKAYELVKVRLTREIVDEAGLFFDWENNLNFSTSPPQRTDAKDSPLGMQKYVYIISHKNFPGEYKVGIAKDWKSRLNSYQTGDPERAYKIEYSFLTPHYREIEMRIHSLFPNKHEWVQGTVKDIKNEIEKFKL